jgi:hypothetical protein
MRAEKSQQLRYDMSDKLTVVEDVSRSITKAPSFAAPLVAVEPSSLVARRGVLL